MYRNKNNNNIPPNSEDQNCQPATRQQPTNLNKPRMRARDVARVNAYKEKQRETQIANGTHEPFRGTNIVPNREDQNCQPATRQQPTNRGKPRMRARDVARVNAYKEKQREIQIANGTQEPFRRTNFEPNSEDQNCQPAIRPKNRGKPRMSARNVARVKAHKEKQRETQITNGTQEPLRRTNFEPNTKAKNCQPATRQHPRNRCVPPIDEPLYTIPAATKVQEKDEAFLLPLCMIA